jgi:hydrogenase small subunit
MKAPKIVADHQPAVQEIHVLWMTTGLGCDGDSVSATAATLPSIEDVVMGAIPGLPKVHLHNPVRLRSRRRFHEVLARSS